MTPLGIQDSFQYQYAYIHEICVEKKQMISETEIHGPGKYEAPRLLHAYLDKGSPLCSQMLSCRTLFFSAQMYRIDPSIFDFLQKQNMQKTFDVYIKTEGLRLLEYFFLSHTSFDTTPVNVACCKRFGCSSLLRLEGPQVQLFHVPRV